MKETRLEEKYMNGLNSIFGWSWRGRLGARSCLFIYWVTGLRLLGLGLGNEEINWDGDF